MKKKAIIRRLISGILALTLSVGVLSATLWKNAEASNAPEVTLTLTTSGANGAMTFTHSALTEEYEGNSATWSPMRYQFDAYKDGSETPEKIWIEFVGAEAYFWGAGNYGNQTVPTTSLKIAKDTVLKECTVVGDVATEKANGKTMVLAEEVSIVKDGELWKQVTSTPVTPPEFTLSLLTSSTNGAMTFTHSDLTEEYEGNDPLWIPVRYQFDAYKDGSETSEKIWIEFVGAKAYFWGAGNYGNQTAPTTSLRIAKDTVFKECTLAGDIATEKADGKTMTLKEEVSIVKDGESWKQETSTPVTPPEFTLTLTTSGANGAMTFSHSELAEEYQGNSATWTPVRYQFDAYKDGSETPEKIWIEFVGAEAYFWGAGNYGAQTAPTTSLKIDKDTVFKECTVAGDIATEKADGKTMVLKEDISIVKDGETWKQESSTPELPPEEPPVTPPVITPPADAPKVVLDFKSEYATGWILSFNKEELYHSGEHTLSSVWIDGTEYYNVPIEFPTWTNELSADEAYMYQQYFPNNTLPGNTFEIKKDTVMTNNTTGQMSVIEETLTVTKTADGWESNHPQGSPENPPEEPPIVTPPIITPPANAPEVLLDFKQNYATYWVLSFDKEEMYHTGFHTLSSVWIDGTEYYNVKIEFPTWTNELSADEAYIYQQSFPNGVMPTSKFEIKKGAVLVNDTTGEMTVVAATLTVKKSSIGWKSNNPVAIPKVCNKIKVEYDRFESNGFYVDIKIVSGPDKGKNVADVYGEWGSVVPTGNISYIRNGKEEKMKVLWPACNGNELYIIGDYRSFINEISHIMLKKNTVITPQSKKHSQVPMVLVNDLTIQKYDEYDIWAEEGTYTKDTKFNDIKVSFVNFDGQGFYFDAKIVSGPDKGKKVADVYGEWAAPSPSGNMTYTLADNGEKQVMNVLWSPCNETQLYISGNYRSYVDQLETVSVKKNTIIIPSMKGKSLTPIRIVNAVDLEKEPVYGLWGLKGKVKTPTEFIDVYLDVKQVRGHALTLSVRMANDKNTKISDILGQGASVFGNIVLEEPGVGKYTDNKAVYTVQDDSFRLFGILPATKDSIKVKAGTVLFAHNACETLKPVRILNSVKLTRDAEDNWKFKTGEKLSPSSLTVTGPQTGDDFSVELYMGLFVAAMVVILSCVYIRRRKIQ